MARYHDLHRLTTRLDAPRVAALGSMVIGAKATFDDADLLLLTDGDGRSVTFEIDVTGTNTPDAANVEIDISGVTTAIDVADLIRVAIAASNLNMTFDASGSATINMTQDINSFDGNTATPVYTPAVAGTGVTAIVIFAGAVRSHSYRPAPNPMTTP